MMEVLFLEWDDEVILAGIGKITRVLGSAYGPGPHRNELLQLRDELHCLCVDMETDGASITQEQHYFAIFDALAYVTDALRGPGVKSASLIAARTRLAAIRDLKREEKAVSS
jgi:hypothetical protein